MNHTTPVLTQSVPYSWDELKKGQLPMDKRVEPPMPASSANFRAPQTESTRTASVPPIKSTPLVQPQATVPAANPAPIVDDKLVREMVDELVPLIMDRLHAQVSIMVDMTMKQAAAKIRNDFDNALKPTVQAAVRQVVAEKLAK